MYCKAARRAMDTESAHEAHERIHDAVNYDATNRISHAPLISNNHIIKSTIQLVEKDVLKQCVEF